ncbi:membrane-spanning 4-domains subfamily A member 4A-like isoform X2 [Scophthalmus maximus]|uniref:membrane-spanning 4-domains subfamily A member 4A-like isoform X2 n=1 Tax=Scophthalmus maximus TaxID=52904 RepID=UPI001FA82166|nr:membrane-spanning 4-domains subfamily A member 4A-like isoform X2 [Scophthalmus maximus]
MSWSVSTTVDGVVVVTHVHPAPQGAGPRHGATLQRFSRSWPLVLGTVQIMIGLIILLFGIAMTVYADSLGVFSGIFVWGAALYIIAGSLTVAAGKYLTRCLVNAALALCVIAAVVSATGTILYSLDAAGLMFYCYYHGSGQYDCYTYMTRTQGVSGVLAVFNLLELTVSITIAGYACRAACNCTQEPPSVVYVPAASVVAQAAPSAQAGFVPATQFSSPMVNNSKGSEQPGAPGLMEPPTYNSVVS